MGERDRLLEASAKVGVLGQPKFVETSNYELNTCYRSTRLRSSLIYADRILTVTIALLTGFRQLHSRYGLAFIEHRERVHE
jgi:hypothetical protein